MATVRVRVTTFPVRCDGHTITRRQYEGEIRRAINAADRIFDKATRRRVRHRIRVQLAGMRHLSYSHSMRLLSLSIEDEPRNGGLPFELRYGRISGEAYRERQEREVALEYGSARRTGVWWGGYALRRHPMYPTQDNRALTREALEILNLNRHAGEVAVYWVPGFNNPFDHGEAIMPWAHRGVTHRNEGIFMPLGRRAGILAHELGHLLMQAGHCSFEGRDGTTEGSAPPDNLMHGGNETRTGKELTRGQTNRMFEQGARYLR